MLRCSVYTPDGKLNCWKLVDNNREAEKYKRGLTRAVRNVTVVIEKNQRREVMEKKQRVLGLLEAQGTKIVTVTFIKANGSERVVNGLLKPTSKIVGSDRGVAQGEAMRSRGQIPIWEIKENQWKSFYAEKVELINGEKV